jgi:hypothetical protein
MSVVDRSTPEILVICNLAAFLMANIMKSEAEWWEWGQPFLRSTFNAQFGDAAGLSLCDQLEERFHPLINERSSLWVETPIGSDYALVSFAEQRLNEELLKLSIDPTVDLDAALKAYLDRFFTYAVSSSYDARARVVARKICLMLNMAARDFATLESNSITQPTETTKDDFLNSFQSSVRSVPRSSLVTSYRMLKVAFVAVGGGAMVGMASVVAAPTIITTIIPLLTVASELLQVSVTLELFLGYVGVLAYPILPSLFTSYGSTVAGLTMLRRTAEIEDFELAPLQNTSCSVLEGKAGAVCILVNGHSPQSREPRDLWGADGASALALLDGEVVPIKECKYSSQTLLERLAKAILSKTAALGHPLLPACVPGTKAISATSGPIFDKEVVYSSEGTDVVATSSVSRTVHLEGSAEINTTAEPKADKAEADEEWESLQVVCRPGWFREVLHVSEAYVLTWEPRVLAKLHDSFLAMLADQLYGKVYSTIVNSMLQLTPLPSITRSMALPLSVLKKIETLNDPWAVALDRARQAGTLLARALLAEKQKQLQCPEQHGCFRPVTLVGYGMGARAIFHCLEHLSQAAPDRGHGIIESAVLMGAPVGSAFKPWTAVRSVVAHRLVNCYSRSDWILALLYRSKALELSIAGLAPVHIHRTSQPTPSMHLLEGEDGSKLGCEGGLNRDELQSLLTQDAREIENMDVTDIAANHSDYPNVLRAILQRVSL